MIPLALFNSSTHNQFFPQLNSRFTNSFSDVIRTHSQSWTLSQKTNFSLAADDSLYHSRQDLAYLVTELNPADANSSGSQSRWKHIAAREAEHLNAVDHHRSHATSSTIDGPEDLHPGDPPYNSHRLPVIASGSVWPWALRNPQSEPKNNGTVPESKMLPIPKATPDHGTYHSIDYLQSLRLQSVTSIPPPFNATRSNVRESVPNPVGASSNMTTRLVFSLRNSTQTSIL